MAGRRKGTFAFDLSHPVKKGVLLKQGAFHKAFKYRFFLVYPGFLVYYEQESKWLLDLTKGETLGGRLGAIKLRGGSCNVARDAPKACKFGLIVHAPDPVNKRPTYLINATSKQDRDEWIEAIRKSIPSSPRQQRKNEGSPKRIKEEPKKIYSDPPPPYPTTSARQDTADVAATVATENERLNGVDESITSIDDSLHEQPTLDVRRDTAATAALSLSYKNRKEDDNQTENNQLTSIDDLLGPRETNADKESDMSDSSSQRTGSPSDSNSIQAQSPEPETSPLVNNEADSKKEESENSVEEAKKEREDERSESNPPPAESSENSVEEAKKEREDERSESNPPLAESSEVVENLQTSTQNSEDVVVTSVTVEVNRDSPVAICEENGCEIKNGDGEKEGAATSKAEEGESQEAKEGETPEKNGESTLSVEKVPTKGGEGEGEEGVEILISNGERSNSFSVNVANIDTDDYSSSEDESPQPPPYVEPPAESEGAATTSSAADANATPTSSEEPPKANGECPTINVETAEREKKGAKDEDGKEKRSSSESSSEGERLSPPVERRRSSQPFIEKKGFLYKMGGKRKTWNLRYFVLRPGVFTYSKNPSSKTLGEVKLKNLQVFFPGLGERKTSFQFTIHTESTWNKRMDWVLAAQSEREMKDWILAFKLAGQKNMPSPATSDNEESSP